MKEMSNAMSNGSYSIMLHCDWLQIRTTTHISTQVIIWISASRWWWKQESPWSYSSVSPDAHREPPYLFPTMSLHSLCMSWIAILAKVLVKILYSALGYGLYQHSCFTCYWKSKTISKKMLKMLHRATRGTMELGDNPLWVHHYEWPLLHYTDSFYQCWYQNVIHAALTYPSLWWVWPPKAKKWLLWHVGRCWQMYIRDESISTLIISSPFSLSLWGCCCLCMEVSSHHR